MSALYACPRCTQVLPTSAKFCRRCGMAVGVVRTPPDRRSTTARPVLTFLLLALGIGGAAFVLNNETVPGPAAPPQSPVYQLAPPPVPASPPVVYEPTVVVPQGRFEPAHRDYRPPGEYREDHRR